MRKLFYYNMYTFTILAEIKPKRGGVPEKVYFYNIKGESKEEALESVKLKALDIAEDIKCFWECKVELKLSLV